MEIADSGRKHGVADEDIRHAVEVAFRLIHHGDDRVLVIGVDRNGRLLEVSCSIPRVTSQGHPCRRSPTEVLQVPLKVMPMTRSRDQLERATRDAEAWLDALDPDTTPAEDAADLRAIGVARQGIEAAEDRLRAAVDAARANGRSWGMIGLVLGVSKQAAHERFGRPARTR